MPRVTAACIATTVVALMLNSAIASNQEAPFSNASNKAEKSKFKEKYNKDSLKNHAEFNKAMSVAKKENRHPFTVSFELGTTDPRLTLNNMHLNYKTGLLYQFNKNFYGQASYAIGEHNYNDIGFLLGMTRGRGKFRPYSEISEDLIMQKGQHGDAQFSYDVGMNFVVFTWVIPTLEFDNFLNRHDFVVQTALTFPMTDHFSIGCSFAYQPSNGHDGAKIKLNYTF